MTKHNSMSTLRLRLKQIAFMAVKLAIVFGAGFFIYQKLIHNDTLDFDYFLQLLNDNNIITTTNISILIIFSLFNWSLESLKWKVLVNEIKVISFTEATKQSLSSLTTSIITPNRIGEYGAKAIYYPKISRKKILGLNLVGNFAQLGVTIIFGIVGLSYVIHTYDKPLFYYKTIRFGFLGIVFLYFLFTYSSRKKHHIKGYSFSRLSRFFKNLHQKTIITTGCLSMLKYIVFAHQFYFLIWLFGIDVSYLEAMPFITSMYLLASVIPTIFILDVVVKGSVAVWLFSFAGANEFVIIAITTIMWIFNFVFPAAIGSYFVLNFKLNQE